jgi:hypothetical protein
MTTQSPSFLLFVALTIGLTTPAHAETKVFLLGGQSNMAGVGAWPGGDTGRGYYPADANCPAPYNAPQAAVKFWNGGWENLQPGFGYLSGTEFGPEVSFGYTLHNSIFPTDEIYLVKYAVSSTALAPSAHQWTPDGTGTTYNTFESIVNAALSNLSASGKSPTIAGMIWMQGESDAYNGSASAATYATNLTNFIGHVRSDFNTPNMPFVLGQIDDYAWGTPENNALVRAAQETVPGTLTNVAWFSTDDLQRAYWGHFGTQGQIDLGIRFANELVLVPEPGTIVLLLMCLVGSLPHLLKWRARW